MTEFALRIFLVNYYLTPPTLHVDHILNEFNCKYIAQVPIIRIYGCTSCGQKVCAHIHGVYPYFYVLFEEDSSIIENSVLLKSFLLNFASCIDRALNVALNSRVDQNHVFQVKLVKGRQYYGYQNDVQYFIKIYLFNPSLVKKVGDLLANGAILNRKIQPYETHISYNLKFLIDYNLYGMNYLFTDCAKFRVSKNYQQICSRNTNCSFNITEEYSQKIWNTEILNENLLMDRMFCSKQSSCELEIDICACDILNIHEIETTAGQNPGLKSLWDEEKQRRLSLGLDLSNLVGEEYEERPLAQPSKSQICLMERWKKIVESRISSTVLPSNQVDDFINASQSSSEENDLVVTHDSIISATQMSDSFIMAATDKPIDNVNSSFCHLVKSCVKLEEDDSIIINETCDIEETEVFPSFSQVSLAKYEETSVTKVSENDENLNYTFLDLTLDEDENQDSDDDINIKSCNSSQDLFEGIIISSESVSSDSVEKLETFDGAEDEESSSSSSDVIITDISYAASNQSSPPIKRGRYSRNYARELLSLSQILKYCKKRPRKKSQISLKLRSPKRNQNNSEASSTLNAKLTPKFDRTRKGTTAVAFSTPLSTKNKIIYESPDISPIKKLNRIKDNNRINFALKDTPPNSPKKFRNQINLERSCNDKLELLNSMKFSVTQAGQSLYEVTQTSEIGMKNAKFSHLTLMSMELFAESCHNLMPNPQTNSVLFICFSVQYVPDTAVENSTVESNPSEFCDSGIVYVNNCSARDVLCATGFRRHCDSTGLTNFYPVTNESELFEKIIDLVVVQYDPDILVGYDTVKDSWGFLFERAFYVRHRLYYSLGRIISESTFNWQSTQHIPDSGHLSELHCEGRIIFDLWTIFRHELTEVSYTFENSVYAILKERVPFYTNQQLLAWWKNDLKRHLVLKYIWYHCAASLRMLTKLDVVHRLSEFARIFGIELYHVMSRGSQFRVESMMLRLAKPLSLVAISPSVAQRTAQKAPECIPLTLEPESGFYTDPIVVLDFQSLYPSIMIAYNYCYASTVGKLDHLERLDVSNREDPYELGCANMSLPDSSVAKIKENVNISPNGVVFVKESITKGIISKMVEEILNTRIMIKKSMKLHSANKTLCRVLDSRQLGLKLIANVTFGYTAASYSGRMPCVEVGDSIVRKARETLERAIGLIGQQFPSCRVVYGDTDSVFVHVVGATKQEAFEIGHRIAKAVTADNPFPIRLKFEKVYLPCILESKKKYVGFSFESPEQLEPIFDAKGIETVRRDNCGIVNKLLRRSLERLFVSHEVDSVKRYLINEFKKIMLGDYNLSDFIIAKEYRGRNRYSAKACVASLTIARRLSEKDPRSEPRHRDRVPYVIIQGAPNDTLISCVRTPLELLFNTDLLLGYAGNIRYRNEPGCRISTSYYVEKQILPPLHRAFSLIGVNVFKWYSQMPKYSDLMSKRSSCRRGAINLNKTISYYFTVQYCSLCESSLKGNRNSNDRENIESIVCYDCLLKGKDVLYSTALQKMRRIQLQRKNTISHCLCCAGLAPGANLTGIGPPCVSTVCPTFFQRITTHQIDTSNLERLLNSVAFEL